MVALVVFEPPGPADPAFLSELEHAAASNANATSAIDTLLMLVLIGGSLE